jgi:hypothetical protein
MDYLFRELKSDSPRVMEWIHAADENEARLKSFYSSALSETTLDYKFTAMKVPFMVRNFVSEDVGVGVFLIKPVHAGELLMVSNAVVSCTCSHDNREPDSPGLDIQTPGADEPRIPDQVMFHLEDHLADVLGTADKELREKVNLVTLVLLETVTSC